MAMRYLVTGASGFVGSNLVRRLVTAREEIHIIIRSHSNLARLADIATQMTVHTADIRDRGEVSGVVQKVRPDVVFHLANLGVYGGVHPILKDVIDVNLLGTANLVDACSGFDYRCFVNTGSSSEYGTKTSPMSEVDRCDPLNAYGVSKCASTMYARCAAVTGSRPIVNLRLFSPYGPFDDHRRLIPYVISRTVAGQELHLASSTSVRDFVYIEDVVDAYLACVNYPERVAGEIVNVGSGSQSSVKDVVNTVLELTGSTSVVRWNKEGIRPGESPTWQANIDKIHNLLNWSPRYSLRDGLKETISWWMDSMSHKSYAT
jgi:nucleoside-diphosphate-sugar epimerase